MVNKIMMKSVHTRNYCLLFLLYFMAHLPIIAFFDAHFWDDWSLYKAAPETILDLFWQAGLPFIGYLHVGLQKIGGWIYPCLTFANFFVIVICAYSILIRLNAGAYSAFWISVLIGIVPVNYARIAAICLPSTLLLTLFMLSWLVLLSLRGKYSLLLRLFTLTGFFLSFQVGSLLVFYLLPIFSYLLMRGSMSGCRNLEDVLKVSIKAADFILLPIIFWYLKSVYFPHSGIFADYNNPVFNFSVFTEPFSPLFGYFIGDGVAVSSGLLLVILLGIIACSSPISKAFPRLDAAEIFPPFVLLIVGLIVGYLSIFPYSAVGKTPSFAEWTSTRHQLLLMFGWAILIFGMICFCVKKCRPISRNSNVIIPLVVVVLCISSWWQIYSEFYVDHLKQMALVALLKKHPELRKKNVVILDNTALAAFDTKTGLGEYAAIYSEAAEKHDSLLLDYDSVSNQGGWKEFTETYSQFLGVWSKTEHVDLSAKPSMYILKKTIHVSNKAVFSIQMLLNRVIRPNFYRQKIENMLRLDGPFTLNYVNSQSSKSALPQ